MPVRGSCHCGKITFSFDHAPQQAIECNCSICRKRGALLAGMPSEAFRLESPRDGASL